MDGRDDIKRLASSIRKYGLQNAELIAEGMLARLHQFCWSMLTDVVEDVRTIDEAIESPLPKGVATKLMIDAGILVDLKGVWHVPSAFRERPAYIARRWKRFDMPGFRAAKKRCAVDPRTAIRKKDERDDPPEQSAGRTDLFGNPVQESPKPKAKASNPLHRPLMQYWLDAWKRTKGGLQYPISWGRDNGCISKILRVVEDLEHGKKVIDAYLRTKEKFYAGHPLTKLVGNLPEFIEKAAGRRNGEVPYAPDVELTDL